MNFTGALEQKVKQLQDDLQAEKKAKRELEVSASQQIAASSQQYADMVQRKNKEIADLEAKNSKLEAELEAFKRANSVSLKQLSLGGVPESNQGSEDTSDVFRGIDESSIHNDVSPQNEF